MSTIIDRSRSPAGNKGNKTDEDFKASIWADFETKLDAKNEVVFKNFKDEVKTVVGSLVTREIERIEVTMASNQKSNEANMASLEKKVDDKFVSLENTLLKAINDNKAPAAPASGSLPSSPPAAGGKGAPAFSVKAAASRYDARPFGGMVAPTPPWVDDVTTPHFNRAADATK